MIIEDLPAERVARCKEMKPVMNCHEQRKCNNSRDDNIPVRFRQDKNHITVESSRLCLKKQGLFKIQANLILILQNSDPRKHKASQG